jgi:hypothetical protein
VTFEESTTFECTKRGISWEAAAETDPVARRADGFFPTDAEAVSVTSDAVFVDEDRGDKASVVRRLDPRTGKTMWARRVGDADRIAAGTERVWVADAARGRVLGLDVRTGTIKSTTDVGPGNFDAIARARTSRSRPPPTACGWRRHRVCSASTRRPAPGSSSSRSARSKVWSRGRAGSSRLRPSPDPTDGLAAIDGSGSTVLRVRGIRGALAESGATVWVLDRGAGGLVRVQGG